jgi:RimJ/RimL family protein N-acetyltransferase
MARQLVDLATAAPEVRRVRAQTLREANASTRILEKLDFVRIEDAEDPEVGAVWRWECAATALEERPVTEEA